MKTEKLGESQNGMRIKRELESNAHNEGNNLGIIPELWRNTSGIIAECAENNTRIYGRNPESSQNEQRIGEELYEPKFPANCKVFPENSGMKPRFCRAREETENYPRIFRELATLVASYFLSEETQNFPRIIREGGNKLRIL